MRTKQLLFTLILFICTKTNAQQIDTSSIRLKLAIAEATSLSMPNITAGIEIPLDSKKSIELGGGYIYHSIDENIPARGYNTYAKFHKYYKTKRGRTKQGYGIGGFYSKAHLKGNLLYNDNNFYYYKKTEYQKERVGIYTEYRVQRTFPSKLFIELNAGVGFTHFSTSYNAPDVIQTDFRNGFVYGEVLNIPVPIFQLKIGFNIF